jgi:hypothetical protein
LGKKVVVVVVVVGGDTKIFPADNLTRWLLVNNPFYITRTPVIFAMDQLVSHAHALLGELTAVLEGVTANTRQCWLLHLQAEFIIHELQQLPPAAQASLGERGALVALHETLRAATAFCGEFKGRHVLRRMRTHKGDAMRFDELSCRFGEVAREAGLALPLDEAAWREAQESDIRAWDAMLAAVETGDVSTADFGSVDGLTDQLAETSAIVVNLRQLQSKQKNNIAVAPASSGGAPFLHDMLAQQEAWEVNPREVKFDQIEDEFGDMRRFRLARAPLAKCFAVGLFLFVCCCLNNLNESRL